MFPGQGAWHIQTIQSTNPATCFYVPSGSPNAFTYAATMQLLYRCYARPLYGCKKSYPLLFPWTETSAGPLFLPGGLALLAGIIMKK